MEPWLSWSIALAVSGLVFYYYNSQQKPQVNKTRASSISETNPPAVKPARKRDDSKVKNRQQAQTASTKAVDIPRVTLDSRNGDANKKSKSTKKQSTVTPAAVARSVAPVKEEQAEEEDNKEWAQQLLSLKKGTTLTAPARTDARSKTVKQSAASLTPNFSSASSNNADADDDWTPARSPALAAGDVSDMLEPTSGGPSILRLTESTKPARAKQQRQAPLEVVETKKQRQNRKKVEERRIQREAEEKDRQVLLEVQRRTARESRGEPAKNGVSSSKPPAVSEWAVKAAARATQAPAVAVSGDGANSAALLDTFERREQSGRNLPSEEDQLNMAKKLSEDESGWNTVPKGKKQQKKTKVADLTESNDNDVVTEPTVSHVRSQVPAPVSAPAPIVPTPAKTYSNGYSATPTYDAGSHPEDSAWSA